MKNLHSAPVSQAAEHPHHDSTSTMLLLIYLKLTLQLQSVRAGMPAEKRHHTSILRSCHCGQITRPLSILTPINFFFISSVLINNSRSYCLLTLSIPKPILTWDRDRFPAGMPDVVHSSLLSSLTHWLCAIHQYYYQQNNPQHILVWFSLFVYNNMDNLF